MCGGKEVHYGHEIGNARDKTIILHKVVKESFSEKVTFE